jgi:hypothetical protein
MVGDAAGSSVDYSSPPPLKYLATNLRNTIHFCVHIGVFIQYCHQYQPSSDEDRKCTGT